MSFAIIAITILLLLLLGMGAATAISSWMDSLCGNTEISRVASPDGRHDAVLFERNCGATTGFATHLSLIPSGAPLPHNAGNIIAAELAPGGVPAPWGGPRITAFWRNEGNLVVQLDPMARVFHQTWSVDGVTVSSEPLPAQE